MLGEFDFECLLSGCRFEIEQQLSPLADHYNLTWRFTRYKDDGFVLMISPSPSATQAVRKAWNEGLTSSDVFATAASYYDLLVWCQGRLNVYTDTLPEF